MRGAQALGFLENGSQRVLASHLVPLEFDFGLACLGGGAELIQLCITQPFAVLKKHDPAVVGLDAQGEGIGLSSGRDGQQE